MPATKTLDGADNYVLQESIRDVADEEYTNAKRLSSTGIVSGNPRIDTSTETFVGQIRWAKPMNPTINILSLTDPTDGTTSTHGSDFLRYIKTARSYGGTKVNMQQVVTQQDGLAKIGRDFAQHRADDQNDALLAVLRGVAMSEVLCGTAEASGQVGLGGQTFDSDPTNRRYGFYVDLGNNKIVVDATSAVQGAARAEGILRAFGMAYKDYEPPFAYLAISPETYASFRSANLVDSDKVMDGNVEFSTIYGGKFRLLVTRSSQGFTPTELTKINTGAGVDLVGTKASFIILPGAVAMEMLNIPEPVEIERKASAYKGGGTTTIWNRWGYVLAPAGYDWNGAQEAFPANADYYSVLEGGTQKALSAVSSGTLASTESVWTRKTASALTLGILPVFHQ